MSFPPHLLIPARLSSVSASKLRSILGSPATTDPWERKARRDNQRSSPSHWAAGWAQQRLHVSLSLSALLRRRERAPHGPARPGLEARAKPAGGTGMSKALDDTHGGYFHEDTFPG
ncbi:unnamed protein product [Lampetra planeri]